MTGDRRPLLSRDTMWARTLARLVADIGITPNQISIAAVGFALIAGLAFWASGASGGFSRILLLLIAAAGCQVRLVCNLIDGLVAVENDKAEPDGPFWNEVPDRISDMLIFVGMGLGGGMASIGWAAACLAVLTAYLRAEGRALGMPADYSGPMAKPQRMAVATGVAVLSILEPLWGGNGLFLLLGLCVILLGCIWTCYGRSMRILRELYDR